MTTAIFARDGNAFEVTIKGHAGYNNGGPDIVCAACSMLTYTLLQSVLTLETEGGLLSYAQDDITDGKFRISGEAADWAQERIKTILDVISDGFALLQEDYPDNVSVFTD